MSGWGSRGGSFRSGCRRVPATGTTGSAPQAVSVRWGLCSRRCGWVRRVRVRSSGCGSSGGRSCGPRSGWLVARRRVRGRCGRAPARGCRCGRRVGRLRRAPSEAGGAGFGESAAAFVGGDSSTTGSSPAARTSWRARRKRRASPVSARRWQARIGPTAQIVCKARRGLSVRASRRSSPSSSAISSSSAAIRRNSRSLCAFACGSSARLASCSPPRAASRRALGRQPTPGMLSTGCASSAAASLKASYTIMCSITMSTGRTARSGSDRRAQPPPISAPARGDVLTLDRLRRRDRLGGLIHKYQLAA
jgi:hypothetical protein